MFGVCACLGVCMGGGDIPYIISGSRVLSSRSEFESAETVIPQCFHLMLTLSV